MDTVRPVPDKRDLAFAALFAGALGSAAVALLFLGVDGLQGSIFRIPSLLGSAIFLGVSPSGFSETRADMLALYSVFHLVAFTAVGAVATLIHAMPSREARSLPALAGGIAAFLGVAAIVADAALLPGIAQAIGILPLLIANGLAAAIMAWFIHSTLQGADAPAPAAAALPVRPLGGADFLGPVQGDGEVA